MLKRKLSALIRKNDRIPRIYISNRSGAARYLPAFLTAGCAPRSDT
jgi:hypothetical protein